MAAASSSRRIAPPEAAGAPTFASIWVGHAVAAELVGAGVDTTGVRVGVGVGLGVAVGASVGGGGTAWIVN